MLPKSSTLSASDRQCVRQALAPFRQTGMAPAVTSEGPRSGSRSCAWVLLVLSESQAPLQVCCEKSTLCWTNLQRLYCWSGLSHAFRSPDCKWLVYHTLQEACGLSVHVASMTCLNDQLIAEHSERNFWCETHCLARPVVLQ